MTGAAKQNILLQEVQVNELRIDAKIGVLQHEKRVKQPLVIDVRVEMEPIEKDRLCQTLDYCKIAADAEALAQEQIGLIETFAERLARKCLDAEKARCVEIVVRKPGALSIGMAATRIILSRGE